MADRRGLFARIESRDDALKTVRDAAAAFLFLAVLQGALGFFLASSMLIDAVAYLVLALALRQWHSRVAAMVLLLFALGAASVTVLNRVGLTHSGGGNVFLAIIVLVVSIRAVEATFKLHGRYAAAPGAAPAPAPAAPKAVGGRATAPGTRWPHR